MLVRGMAGVGEGHGGCWGPWLMLGWGAWLMLVRGMDNAGEGHHCRKNRDLKGALKGGRIGLFSVSKKEDSPTLTMSNNDQYTPRFWETS